MTTSAKVLTTPDYLRVLRTEKLLTFEINVNGQVSHHQISVLRYDTREKIERRMAEVLVQVAEELDRNSHSQRVAPLAPDIQQLVDDHMPRLLLH